MADTTLHPASEWKKVRREYRVARFAPVITIRRGGALAISADFVRRADISGCTMASLFLSADGYKLGIQFHSNTKDDDAFVMSRDGGGGSQSGMNRLISAGALIRQSPAITALLREARGARRHEPQRDRDGLWVIDLAPCFEKVVLSPSDLDRQATGIYRYRLADDVVYIGRGRMFDRACSPDRRTWVFDRIEFSVLNDEAAERRWESHWLNEYRDRNGRWPTYNRIGGVADKATG